jgi:hypothetical protein
MLRPLLVALVLTGCAPTARLTGRWIFLTGGDAIAIGQSDQPMGGGPMHLVPGSPAAGACLTTEELDGSFGPRCPHEPEGEAPGIEERVRWYCGGSVAVRVRLEPCERRGRVRVVELAVATAPE